MTSPLTTPSLTGLLPILLFSLVSLPQTAWGQVLYSCNFDMNLCEMQSDGGQLQWNRRELGTPTADTGPSATQAGLGYAYMESSAPAENNQEARMYTPALEYTGAICVTFYYHMYGADVNRFELYRRNSVGQRTVVYSLEGNKGNQWIKADVDVTLQSASDRVGFTAVRGTGFRGDIAIDTMSINRGSCESSTVNLPFECSFEEENICEFRQSAEDQFDWSRSRTGTPTENSGPDEAAKGQYYMFIETSDPRNPNDRAILESPTILASGDACLEFSYHMYGENIGSLMLYTTSRGPNSPWRTLTGASTNVWKSEKVQIELQNEDRIGFIGTRGNGVAGDIAIDYVRIYAGNCEDVVFPPSPTMLPPGERNLPFDCSFETDLCEMFQRTNDQYDWTRHSGSTITEGTGPTKARLGTWYAYAEASSPRQPNDRTFLETPSLIYTGTVCILFYYHMYEVPSANHMGTLTVYRYRDGSGDTSLFSVEGKKGDMWLQATITTELQERDKIVFAATRGQDIRSDIAIDGINIKQGSCSPGTSEPTPPPAGTVTPPVIEYGTYNCGGEGEGSSSSSCRMRQDVSDNMQWTLMTGKTPSGRMHSLRDSDGQTYPVTGPDGAATGNSYLYMETSQKTPGQVARLLLEGSDFTRSGDNCLQFQYSMNGFHIGELRVYTIQNGQREIRWRMIGDQKPGWKRAAVDMNLNGVSQIGIEGTVGEQFSGDIALDDIQMRSGRCEPTPSNLLWQCNFETSSSAATFCNMEQDVRDTTGFDWTLQKGQTPSQETGPERAFNGDYYIFIEASTPRNNGDRASILLPVLNRSGTVCILYYYNMNGFHTGSLQVYTRRGSFDNEPVNTLSGNKGNEWHENRVTINNLQTSDQIAFRGIRGSEFSGDIALDNIRVRSGAC